MQNKCLPYPKLVKIYQIYTMFWCGICFSSQIIADILSSLNIHWLTIYNKFQVGIHCHDKLEVFSNILLYCFIVILVINELNVCRRQWGSSLPKKSPTKAHLNLIILWVKTRWKFENPRTSPSGRKVTYTYNWYSWPLPFLFFIRDNIYFVIMFNHVPFSVLIFIMFLLVFWYLSCSFWCFDIYHVAFGLLIFIMFLLVFWYLSCSF